MGTPKLQIALYWAAACGGCDVAVLDTDEFILTVAEHCDIRLWPIAADGKYADVEAMADGELDLTLFNGAVRNSENLHLAKLLRAKSKILVACGSCAHLGGIPGLANLTSREEIFDRAFLHNASIEPANVAVPRPRTRMNGHVLEIPEFLDRVFRLDQAVRVDYTIPGCPPAPEQIQKVLLAVVQGTLPPPGSIVGASDRTVCDECARKKDEKKIREFHRPHEILTDPDVCLLDQGLVCSGPVTRGGCGVRCPDSAMPCRGCYGPPPGVVDQGAKLISAIASVVDSKDPREIERILAGIPDLVGTAYRFGLPASLLERRLS